MERLKYIHTFISRLISLFPKDQFGSLRGSLTLCLGNTDVGAHILQLIIRVLNIVVKDICSSSQNMFV